MNDQRPDQLISSILKHDSKQTSYKIALLRAINDVVLSYPDMLSHGHDVAIPLKALARYWIAYYWSFTDLNNPIYQGTRAYRYDRLTNDMAFRPALTELRQEWEQIIQSTARSSDGFFLINELNVPRRQTGYLQSAPGLVKAYDKAIRIIMVTIEKQPVRYAGTGIQGDYGVFQQVGLLKDLEDVTAIPMTQPNDRCIVVPFAMWESFRDLSLWVEALCIHEWSLFTESVDPQVHRGQVFTLLTDRPGNRVPLDWERNRILLLMQEGVTFTCIWTHRPIGVYDAYDLDHLIPVSIYPINELWNLVPTHPSANTRKSNKIPALPLLHQAYKHLVMTYDNYDHDRLLTTALKEDSQIRFSTLTAGQQGFNHALAERVLGFMDHIAVYRNLARVDQF